MSVGRGTRPAVGQRWWHPKVGDGFGPGVARLVRRAAPSGGELGWDYESEDGAVGWLPESELVELGEPHEPEDADA